MCAGLSSSPNPDHQRRPVRCEWLLISALLLMVAGCERNGRSDSPPTLSINAPGSGSGIADSQGGAGSDEAPSRSAGGAESKVDSLFAFVDPPPDSPSDGTTAASESADKPAGEKPRRQNRLARETSPYLLLHAHNPVDWYPWGPEAFEKAAAENKPIFLSVGYSSCYWCHVMERLVFQNEEIAAYMNQHFINIKVDREERPDIDDIYMTALQIYLQLAGSGGSGGWPLSMFLTPDGKPIAGGTYFPPDDMENRPGFPSVMSRINDAWQNRRDDLTSVADTLTRLVQRQMLPGLTLEKTEIGRELVEQAVSAVVQSHDPEFGGVDFDFNSPDQPKFPVPTRLALLQYDIRENKNAAAERALYQTLDQMAAGGIHDHLGGGFHRYSTDRQWLVPHFEKMLYDNAQLADVYLDAYRATQKSHYRDVAEDILNFLLTSMLDANGGFHSAIDAENDGIEGKYYVWSKEQIEQSLGPPGTIFMAAYGMDRPSTFEHGYVLHMPRSIPDLAADLKLDPAELRLRLFDMRKRLLEVRGRRESPLKDDKILTSWNGLTIRALVNAGVVLNESRYLDAADRAMMFVLTSMRDEQGRLLRTSRGRTARLNAYLDDYAFIIDALLTMHLATRDEKWLTAARRLTDDQLQMFHDDKNGGFFFTSHHHEQLLARTRNGWDAVLPSGNSVSVRNLIRLASLTQDDKYRKAALSTLEAFASQLKSNPRGMTTMALAMGEYLDNRDYRSLTQRVRDKQQTDAIAKAAAERMAADEAAAAARAANNPPAPEKRPPLGAVTGEVAPSVPSSGSTGRRSEPSPGVVQTSGQTPQSGQTQPPQPAATATGAGTARPASPERVKAEAFLSADELVPGTTCRIVVALTIAPGWHINANPASPDYLIPTTVAYRSDSGVTLGNLKYPKHEELPLKDSNAVSHVYGGKVLIEGELQIPADLAPGAEKFELHIRYQACNEAQCERPQTLKFAGGIPIAGAAQ